MKWLTRGLPRRSPQRLRLVLAVGFVTGVIVLIALMDVSRWPLIPRSAVRGPTPPPPPAVPHVPPQPPAPPVSPPPAVPAPEPPPLPLCTAGATPPQSPPRPAVPAPEKGLPPFGPGRGFLEGGDPTFSADGRSVAFVTDWGILISSLDGLTLRRLTRGSQPSWAPDGTRIAFTFEDDVWVVDPEGSSRRRLTTEPSKDWEPAWSPDGAHIAFTSERGGRRDVWIMRADGTDQRRVTDDPVLRSTASPSFSPDGRRLVFAGRRQGGAVDARHSTLMIVGVDGSGLCRLTDGLSEDREPAWSSRGIAFNSYRQPQDGTIWIVQPDGSGLTPLPGTHGSDPAWSPDGARVVFGDGTVIEVFDLADRTVRSLMQFNVIPLQIYIKPGSSNTIDPKSDRSIPVAILSAPWFDPVRRIDKSSIRFGPAGKGRAAVSCTAVEINKDGVADLVCEFDVADAFTAGEAEAVLLATGVDGIPYEGRDAVRLTPIR